MYKAIGCDGKVYTYYYPTLEAAKLEADGRATMYGFDGAKVFAYVDGKTMGQELYSIVYGITICHNGNHFSNMDTNHSLAEGDGYREIKARISRNG